MNKCSIMRRPYCFRQGCSGAFPQLFPILLWNEFEVVLKLLFFWMRSLAFFISTTSLVLRDSRDANVYYMMLKEGPIVRILFEKDELAELKTLIWLILIQERWSWDGLIHHKLLLQTLFYITLNGWTLDEASSQKKTLLKLAWSLLASLFDAWRKWIKLNKRACRQDGGWRELFTFLKSAKYRSWCLVRRRWKTKSLEVLHSNWFKWSELWHY